MSIDISQFHQIFFEESFEGLDAMENSLLELEPGSPDAESINTIFRAAHSIKGGSATFGFSQVAEFTHILETLLDEVRSGDRQLAVESIELLLQSVDCLREMLSQIQNGDTVDMQLVGRLSEAFNVMLQQSSTAPVSRTAEPVSDTTPQAQPKPQKNTLDAWHIRFMPQSHILKTGNEPYRMFRELSVLGDLDVTAHTEKVPAYAQLAPLDCFIHWSLVLHADCEKALIEEIFEWVVDDCELVIERASAVTEPVATGDVAMEAGEETADTETPAMLDVEPPVAEPSAAKAVAVAAVEAKGGADVKNKVKEGASIRVSIDKVDSLINMVGELVITQSMLGQLGENFEIARLEQLRNGLAQLEHNTRELQESVMSIRMMPISFVFNRFPRMVRDLATKLGKKIKLEITGEQTELDKTVMENIGDPLVHLVRNAVDHGLEMPEQRRAKGKSEYGTIQLNAFHQSGNIVIEISEDGAGLNRDRILQKAIERGLVDPADELSDEQIHHLIFAPGFSTADAVSDLSGRGVGMDVVRKNINKLGGMIDVATAPNKGTTFTIRLPLTLAIMDGQLIQVGEQVYIIPLISVIESLQVDTKQLNKVAGHSELYRLRDSYIPILRLHELFNIPGAVTDLTQGLLVIVEGEGLQVGLFVDDLLSQQQVVIKSLESNFKRLEGIAGATILGDGTVSLIVDVVGLIRNASALSSKQKTKAIRKAS